MRDHDVCHGFRDLCCQSEFHRHDLRSLCSRLWFWGCLCFDISDRGGADNAPRENKVVQLRDEHLGSGDYVRTAHWRCLCQVPSMGMKSPLPTILWYVLIFRAASRFLVQLTVLCHCSLPYLSIPSWLQERRDHSTQAATSGLDWDCDIHRLFN